MAASAAKIEANRKNAQKSTGPTSTPGKERSRANALKHGLCASAVVPEDIKVVQQRADEWFFAIKPRNSYQSWMVERITIASLRIERAERMERRYRDRESLRAETTWDDDRKREAEALGARICKRPSQVGEQLRATPQGCDWLLARWSELARCAEVNASWTADQAQLAFDLLGTHPDCREGRQLGERVDLEGRLVEPAPPPLVLARREVKALKARRKKVAPLDEVDRSLTSSDLLDEANVPLKLLRRYEAALHNRLRWCLEQVRSEPPRHQSDPDHRPRWVEPPGPDLKPGQVAPAVPVAAPGPIHPPFDLRPDEVPGPGEVFDLPGIVAGRREKKLRKAEARRDARRRKVERLRG